MSTEQFLDECVGCVCHRAGCFGGAGACNGGTACTDRSVCGKALRRWTQRDEFYHVSVLEAYVADRGVYAASLSQKPWVVAESPRNCEK